MLAANELLTRVIDLMDRERLLWLTSDQAVFRLGLPRGYMQRVMSRLRRKGLLGRFRCRRTVASGYFRGFCNAYFPTLRGRKRAAWWKEANSIQGLGYLSSGTGASGDIAQCLNSHIATGTMRSIVGDQWGVWRIPETMADGRLLTCVSGGNPAYLVAFQGLEAQCTLEVLKREGLLPPQIEDPSLFASVAKHGYRRTDTQIRLSVLYRSARHWKATAEHWNRTAEYWMREYLSLLEKKLVKTDDCELTATVAANQRPEQENLSLRLKNISDNLSMRTHVQNVNSCIDVLSDGLDELDDGPLAVRIVRSYTKNMLALLKAFNTICMPT
jgi:hypothetical protein